MRRGTHILIVGLLLGVGGLFLESFCLCQQPKPSPPAAPQDFVSGEWAGTWRNTGRSTIGGKLICKVTATGAGKWKGTFTAPMPREATYDVELVGRREGDAVVIDGNVTLRNNGGRYRWTCKVTRHEFSGTYTGAYDGDFKMAPAKPSK